MTDPELVLAALSCVTGLISEGHLEQAQDLTALLYQRVASDANHPQAELVKELRQPPMPDWAAFCSNTAH